MLLTVHPFRALLDILSSYPDFRSVGWLEREEEEEEEEEHNKILESSYGYARQRKQLAKSATKLQCHVMVQNGQRFSCQQGIGIIE